MSIVFCYPLNIQHRNMMQKVTIDVLGHFLLKTSLCNFSLHIILCYITSKCVCIYNIEGERDFFIYNVMYIRT